MPNFSADEGRTLSGDDLGLATQSRQPQLRALSDAELETLVTRLRAARDRARQDARQPASPEDPSADEAARKRLTYLEAALRRASAERKRRLGQAAKAAGAALSKAEADTPSEPKPDKPKARKPAARGARGGARAARRGQVTDRRGSGARKLPKAKPAVEGVAKPEAPAPKTPVPPKAPAPTPTEAPPVKDAPTALVQDLTEKAATHAAKAEKAHSKAEKAAKRAEKKGRKKDLKAAEEAQEKARKARRKARKFARRARKAAADLD